MPEINGKTVLFRAKLPAAIWWPIMPKLQALSNAAVPMDALDWDTVCQMVHGAVKSWEFDGEPSDPEAVGALDLLTELTPLMTEIAQLIVERAPSGEAGKRPT